jgi:hypothetical protein
MPSVARLEQQEPPGIAAVREDGEFMQVLEDTVRRILANRKTKPEDRTAAINAGIKLLAIKHRISGGDVKGFFD